MRLPGGTLQLDVKDRHRLREYIHGLHGLDPLLDELDASMNKVRAFDEQYRPELIERIPEGWLQAYEWMVCRRAGFTQEALLARGVSLRLLVS